MLTRDLGQKKVGVLQSIARCFPYPQEGVLKLFRSYVLQLVSNSLEQTPEARPSLTQTIAIDVTGMKCAGCVRVVEQELKQCEGVVAATVNLATEVATVEYELQVSDPDGFATRLTQAGFPSELRLPASERSGEAPALDLQARRQQAMQEQMQRLAIAILLLLLSTLGHLGQLTNISIPFLSNIWFHCGLATVALLGSGRTMIVDGWRGLRRNAPNMNTLVSLGTLTAYSTSLIALLFPTLGWECFFDEPVMLVGFILLGRTLEQQARNRAASAFQSLLALQPKVARLIQKDESGQMPGQLASAIQHPAIEIPADCVRAGEWLQVLPGDRIPVDGQVVAGQTTVNESMLTGEALPVVKQPGDGVVAGTLNLSGTIALRATRTGNDTTLAQIIALVETAQTRKAPIQKLADTVAGYFTYGVMAISSLTFLFWYCFGIHLFPSVLMEHSPLLMFHAHLLPPHAHLHPSPSPLLLSLKLAIAVLVVACPCALGLATPTAILVGSGIGAERGLLIRGGDILERVHHLDTIVLDKTGTLTTGNPVVTDCIALEKGPGREQQDGERGRGGEGFSPSTLLQLAATVESGTRHPLALAIQQQALQQELALLPAQDFVTMPGLGVAATVLFKSRNNAPVQVVLGTEQWLTQQGVEMSHVAHTQAQELGAVGKTVVYMAVDGVLTGLIAVSDPLRPDAIATVAQLRRMGLKVMLLTGDREEVARAIARPLLLPAENILAQVRPEQKAQVIAQLQAEGHRVAMVGDGINDAPALAQADVGIALHSGTDVARETASILLMRDRLADVVESILLSRRTFNKIRQNLFWAFAYNVLSIPLAAGVLLPGFGILLNPAAAGAMMAFSSVSVVTNSLLLYLTIPPSHPITQSFNAFRIASEPLADHPG
jgi:Cu2+-exporting ATPase